MGSISHNRSNFNMFYFSCYSVLLCKWQGIHKKRILRTQMFRPYTISLIALIVRDNQNACIILDSIQE